MPKHRARLTMHPSQVPLAVTGIRVIVSVICRWTPPSLDKCHVAEAPARVKAAHAPSAARAALRRGGASAESNSSDGIDEHRFAIVQVAESVGLTT